jgi:hypothetical protein
MKKLRKDKVQRPSKPVYCPHFSPGERLGNFLEALIVSDSSGRVWRIDQSGAASPVIFSEK